MDTYRREATLSHMEGINHRLTSTCIILTHSQRVHPLGHVAQKSLIFVGQGISLRALVYPLVEKIKFSCFVSNVWRLHHSPALGENVDNEAYSPLTSQTKADKSH